MSFDFVDKYKFNDGVWLHDIDNLIGFNKSQFTLFWFLPTIYCITAKFKYKNHIEECSKCFLISFKRDQYFDYLNTHKAIKQGFKDINNNMIKEFNNLSDQINNITK